jgi:hypothetical protein
MENHRGNVQGGAHVTEKRPWPGTYRKALWGMLRRRDRLAVKFVGSQVMVTSLAPPYSLRTVY